GSYFQSIGSKDICLFSVGVIEQRDACGTGGIIFNAFYNGRNSIFCSLEIDTTEALFVSAANVTDSHLTVIVASSCCLFTTDQRLFRFCCSDIIKRTANLVSLPRCCGL